MATTTDIDAFVCVDPVYGNLAIPYLVDKNVLRIAPVPGRLLDKFNHAYETAGGRVVALVRTRCLEYGAQAQMWMLDREWFDARSLEVSVPHRRRLSGTEYEMLCRKLEARACAVGSAESDIILPPWTQEIYDACISRGETSFRGKTAWITWHTALSFREAITLESGDRDRYEDRSMIPR